MLVPARCRRRGGRQEHHGQAQVAEHQAHQAAREGDQEAPERDGGILHGDGGATVRGIRAPDGPRDAGPARGGAPRGADAAGLAGGLYRPGAPARRGLGAAHRDRERPPPLDDPLRAARAPGRRRSRASLAQRATPPSRRRQRGRGGPRRGARRCIERPSERRRATGEPTIFFLDEIHRFNKAQQDALLPAVEEGLVTLVGRDHREPLLRGQLGADLAHAHLRAASAGGRRTAGAAAARARARRCAAARDVPDDGARVPGRRGRAATRARRCRRSSWRARRSSRERGVAARSPRTRSSAARCATTRAATATTT